MAVASVLHRGCTAFAVQLHPIFFFFFTFKQAIHPSMELANTLQRAGIREGMSTVEVADRIFDSTLLCIVDAHAKRSARPHLRRCIQDHGAATALAWAVFLTRECESARANNPGGLAMSRLYEGPSAQFFADLRDRCRPKKPSRTSARRPGNSRADVSVSVRVFVERELGAPVRPTGLRPLSQEWLEANRAHADALAEWEEDNQVRVDLLVVRALEAAQAEVPEDTPGYRRRLREAALQAARVALESAAA